MRIALSGLLRSRNIPYQVRTTVVTSGAFSARRVPATLLGPSALHPGYLEWDVTGNRAKHDLYRLNVPEVLPPGGGFFDAVVQILFNGGADGNVQVQLFDCTVTTA